MAHKLTKALFENCSFNQIEVLETDKMGVSHGDILMEFEWESKEVKQMCEEYKQYLEPFMEDIQNEASIRLSNVLKESKFCAFAGRLAFDFDAEEIISEV